MRIPMKKATPYLGSGTLRCHVPGPVRWLRQQRQAEQTPRWSWVIPRSTAVSPSSETRPGVMTAISLLNSDRQGAIIMKGIEGETKAYNGTDYTYHGPADCEIVENTDGTVDYNFKLREDLKFSDGEPITIDDVIFSMYVLCDPTYDGNTTLFALPIQGMDAYRSGMDTLYNLMLAAGRDNTDFSKWKEADQTAFWADWIRPA